MMTDEEGEEDGPRVGFVVYVFLRVKVKISLDYRQKLIPKDDGDGGDDISS